MKVVVLSRRCFSAARMDASVSVSTALIESSNINMGAFCISIRAIATRCFCPPERVTPRSPTTVSYPFSKPSITSCTQAMRAASCTCSSLMRGSIMRMFSIMVRE